MALAGVAAYAVFKITKAYLKQKAIEEAQKRNLEAASMRIKRMWQTGDYSKVKSGLYDENDKWLGDFTVSEKGELDDELEVGEVLELAA